MTKIEENALRIAELMKFIDNRYCGRKRELLIKEFSSYQGLMPIVESEISEYELKSVHFEVENIGLLESVQNYVIKYLELKNNAGKAN